MNSPASKSKLQELWKALLKTYRKIITQQLKDETKTIPISQINSIRLFLSDNHITKPTPTQTKLLQQLHTDLAKQLSQAIQSPSCNSPTLEVIRRFLIDNNITKDVATHLDLREGLKVLSGMDLPFNNQ